MLRKFGSSCFLLAVVVAQATTIPHLPPDQLTAQADVAIQGTVLRTWSEWDTAHKYIWTRSEIQVKRVYKGVPGKVVVVNEPGGVAEGRGMQVAGSVQYTAGESVVVFLKDYPGTGYRTLGWGQGKYSIDNAGKLHSDHSIAAVDVIDLKSGSRITTPVNFNGLDLDVAERRISSYTRQGAAK